ncbi:MAG: hypothetical protein J5843_02460, partial [Clostridia bacterium]|nr:hypothetical protein [Clostridia bacterium]
MKTSFRICATWLMLAALLASMILPANASGSGAPFSGSGTADDPYLIQSPEDLANLATIIRENSHSFSDGETEFALTRDLDLSQVCCEGENWRPIGELPNNGSHKRFKYHFDGRGHVISHLYIGNPTQSCQGLFGEVGGGAVIRNLILDSTCYVSSTWNNTGGLIGAIGG